MTTEQAKKVKFYSLNVQTMKKVNAIMGSADKDIRGKYLYRQSVNITLEPSKQSATFLATNGFTVYKIVIPFEKLFNPIMNYPFYEITESNSFWDLSIEHLRFIAKSPYEWQEVPFEGKDDNLNDKAIKLLTSNLNSTDEIQKVGIKSSKYDPALFVNIFKGLKSLKLKSVKLVKKNLQFFIFAETEEKLKISFAVYAMYEPTVPQTEPYEF